MNSITSTPVYITPRRLAYFWTFLFLSLTFSYLLIRFVPFFFRPKYFNNPSAGNPAYSEGQVQGNGPRRDNRDILPWYFTKAHNGAVTEFLTDVFKRNLEFVCFRSCFLLRHVSN